MTSDQTLAKRWPDQLVEQLSRNNCVLVVGAGVSLNSTNNSGDSPPSWSGLIKELAKTYCSVRAKTDVNNLIKQANFLEAAQYLKMQARGSAKESDFLSTIAEATDGNSQGGGNFMPSKFHDTLLRLNPDIIVTTNYDKILERASASGYKVHDYASTAIGRLVRSGQPLIIKIHGSIDDPDGIILTRADYARLRKQGSDALEVLQALFLTRTALFIGYSLNDPDIQLVLENVLGARDEPISHYMLASKDVKEYQRDVLRYCYGTDIVSYRPGDYEEMFKMLVLLADLVDAKVASRALP